MKNSLYLFLLVVSLSSFALADMEILTLPSFPEREGRKFPTWSWHWQDNSYFNYPRNLTFYVDATAHACTANISINESQLLPRDHTLLPGTQGRAVLMVGADSQCRPVKKIREWGHFASVVFQAWAPQDMDELVMEYQYYRYQAGDAQLLQGGDEGESDETFFAAGYPPWYDITDHLYIYGGNCSVRLTQPRTVTGAQRQIHTPGSFASFVIYGGIVGGLTLILVGTVKLLAMLRLEGGPKFSIPQIVLSLTILTGFDLTWITLFTKFLPNPVPLAMYDFCEDIGFPLVWTSVMIMGFYFKEVSMLTSAQGKNGAVLDKLRIPSAIILTLMWLFFLISQIIFVVDPISITGDKISGFYQLKPDPNSNNQIPSLDVVQFTARVERGQAGVAIFTILVCSFIMVYGVVSLLIGLRGAASSAKKTIIRIIILSSIIVIVIMVLGIMRWTWRLCDCDPAIPFDDVTNFYHAFVPAKYAVFHHFFAGLAILLSFRVSESKEIEVSRSATGSTSGSSSSGSSSGASSSSASSASSGDPVIEL